MLQPVRVFFNQIRTFRHLSTPKKWKDEDGVKYGLITYFPRHKDHKDPPIKPTKLLLIERVKRYKGNPYWEKRILEFLKIHQEHVKREQKMVIVKNIPEICAQLWTIKHLIKVTPIEIPENLPDDIDSITTYLHDNGKLLVFPKIDERRLKATEEFMNNPKKMDAITLKEKMRLDWLNAMA